MQYDQAQGVYPQVAGSFYNVGGMSPHDNGRIASQVPTFSGGISGLMGANYAMQNFSGLTTGQSAMQYRASAMEQALASKAGIAGGLGLAATVGGGLASLGSSGLLSMLGLTNPFTLPLAAAGMVASGYKERIDSVIGLRNALQTSVFNSNMVDPFTGTLKLTTANQLNSSLKQGAHSLGMPESDLRKTLAFAGNSGMLANSSSVSDITSRVMDLAKVSKEIMQIGEGITAQDAMELQKLMSDMGIGKSKLKGMQLGKNLVQAARAANISLDSVIQAAGAGAATYQQLGLGAAAGMNAATYTMMSANALSRSSNMDPTMLRKLGGAEGMQQALLGGAASTSARISDALVLGSLKMNSDGSMGIDYDLVDRYARGAVTQKDLLTRGTNLTKGMSNSSKAAFMQQLQFSMPSLKEQASDMLNTEQVMAIQGREILSLAEKSGLSVKQAAYSYFGDQAQAESFIAYSQDFAATRDARATQAMMSRGDEVLRRAAQAKSGDYLSRSGRAIGGFFNAIGEGVGSVYDATIGSMSDSLANTDLQQLEYSKRGMRLLGSGYLEGGMDPDSAKSRGLGLSITQALTGVTSVIGAREQALEERKNKLATAEAQLRAVVDATKSRWDTANNVRGQHLVGADTVLNELGVDINQISTFMGDDIETLSDRVFNEDSVLDWLGDKIRATAPVTTNNEKIQAARRFSTVYRSTQFERTATQRYRETVPDAKTYKGYDAFRDELIDKYKKLAKGEGGTVAETLVNTDARALFKARFRDELRKGTLQNVSYEDQELIRTGLAKSDTAVTNFLATATNLSGSGAGGEFEQDTLVTTQGTITAAGLDRVLVGLGSGATSNINKILGELSVNSKATDERILNSIGIVGTQRSKYIQLLRVLRNGTFKGNGSKGPGKALTDGAVGGLDKNTLTDRLTSINSDETRAMAAELSTFFNKGGSVDSGVEVIKTIGTLGSRRDSNFEGDTLFYLGNDLKLDKRGAKYQGLANYARELQDEINQGTSSVEDARNKLFQRIQSLSRAQDKTTPEGQGSSDLNSVMSKINEGLTAFNTALTQIAAAAASSESKEVTIKLKPSTT